MRYASLGGGVDSDLTPIQPKVGTIGAQPQVWAWAAQAAGRSGLLTFCRADSSPHKGQRRGRRVAG